MTTQDRGTRCPHTTQWLTVEQVCDRAHVGRTWLYQQWADGAGPRYSQVGKHRLVQDGWLHDWLLSREVRG